MKKRSLALLIIATLIVTAVLGGCSSESKAVLTINGNNISEDIFTAAIAQADMSFKESYGQSMLEFLDEDIGDGKTGADMLRENALTSIKQYEAFKVIAKENGVELTDEDRETIKQQKETTVSSVGGRKAFLDQLSATGSNEAYLDYMMEGQMLASKVQSLFVEGGKYEVTPESAAALLSSGEYARVKHILIIANEGDPAYASKKATAESVAARAAAGEDFEALLAEFGEDPGMQTYVDGYVIDTDGFTLDANQMLKEFTEASHKLSPNQVSGIVPSSYGFHIIKRYPLDEAYVTANYEIYTPEITQTAYLQLISKTIAELDVKETDAYNKIDVHKILKDIESKQKAQQQ